MYLTVSFLDVPEYQKNTCLYAYYIDKSDEGEDNYYALVTDKKPINDIEICTKIPEEIIENIKEYFFVINSKDGYESSREDIIVFNTIFSHNIEEFNSDIINYIPLEFKEAYENQLSKKKIYYNYSFNFNEMILNNGKLTNFDNFKSKIKKDDIPVFNNFC